MSKNKFILLAVLMFFNLKTQVNSVPEKIEKTGVLVYIGPTPRLMMTFSPPEWSRLSLELQLEQIRLDSLCYTSQWLRGLYKKHRQTYWERRIENGTKESREWGIDPKDYSSDILNFTGI